MNDARKNILVIRSATRILNQTLQSLKREFPDARIAVLAPGDVRDNLALDPAIDEVIPFNNRHARMSVLGFGMNNVRNLRRRGFDLAVALYNVDHGLGYSNIDGLAWASGAAQMRGYNAQGKFTVLTPASVVKKYLLEKTTLLWVAANHLATAVLFVLITLGLLAEWCVRKLAPPAKKAE